MARNPYFESKALIPLKGMLEVSKPERLKEVSEHWKNVEAELRSAADDLKKAVEHATQNWQGVAAQGFATRAGVIHTSMSNTAAHAVQTSSAMNYASQALSQSKSAMNGIDVPSSFESGMKWASDLGQQGLVGQVRLRFDQGDLHPAVPELGLEQLLEAECGGGSGTAAADDQDPDGGASFRWEVVDGSMRA
ncbi:WXG100 family type VII secretion target, partial [Kitasatospora nipponensis]|uniref:WXG100 family type VII secretion target n=1 Tax=Kitasatospora nipponensis TaxID=258049 RepID=UPI003CD0A202